MRRGLHIDSTGEGAQVITVHIQNQLMKDLSAGQLRFQGYIDSLGVVESQVSGRLFFDTVVLHCA